jgi:hypothetical protein
MRRDFLRSHGIEQRDIDLVWAAVALHTTPGIPKYMHPVIALINAGVLMDAVGITSICLTCARGFVTRAGPPRARPNFT